MVDWAHERTLLLPKSGVGVVQHWLVVAPPRNPVIRLDLRALDEIWRPTEDDEDADRTCDIMLACGDLEVAMRVVDGPEAIDRIVREAAPHTREVTGDRTPVDPAQLLIVGDDAVLFRDRFIQIGRVAFRVDEVREYALRGANVPLTNGRVLQAAMALLVVAAAERDT